MILLTEPDLTFSIGPAYKKERDKSMFVLDSKNLKPLYVQLYQQIKNKILVGNLKHGTKLPSSRRLSEDLQIGRNTVEMAYQQLASEGYLISKPRSGYYIGELDISLVPLIQKLEPGKIENEELSQKNFNYDFQYGTLKPNNQLISKWQMLTNYCLREYRNQLSDYLFVTGELGLRKEIMKYLHDYRGVKCSLDQIIIGSGTSYSISLICQLLLKENPSIAIEEPGFIWAYKTFQNYNFSIHPIKLDDFGLRVEQLKTIDANTVYVTPSHQFPTGKIMPIARRLELVDWAVKQNGLIIEDDYSCHLRYNTKPIPALQSLCPNQVIYLGSFSKFLFPSVRVSYLVLPKHLATRFHEMFNSLPSIVPFITQKTLELFMIDGNWDSYLRKTTRQYKKKHDVLIESLKKEFGDNILISGVGAGLHILIQVKWHMKVEELIFRAAQVGVNILHPYKLWFGKGDETYGTILLGFGGIESEDIPNAIQLLRQAWLS